MGKLLNLAGVLGTVYVVLLVAQRAFTPAPKPIAAAAPAGIVLRDEQARVM